MRVLTVDYLAPNADEVFVESLTTTGFAVIKNHPIHFDLVSNVYREWKDFFASDTKEEYLFNKSTQDGYFPPHVSETAKGYDIKDLKEFFQVYPWGRYPQKMSDATRQLYAEMSLLGGVLLEWVEKHTPAQIREKFSMPLHEMIKNSSRTMLRVLHYPPLTGNEESGAVRSAAHEDINLITLLPAATAPGLQVKDSQEQWHDVECDFGTLVVNAGDMLQMCSEGFYRSTTHRVKNPTGEEAKTSRLSSPLFVHPRDEVQLSKGYTGKSYLDERLKELGLI